MNLLKAANRIDLVAGVCLAPPEPGQHGAIQPQIDHESASIRLFSPHFGGSSSNMDRTEARSVTPPAFATVLPMGLSLPLPVPNLEEMR